MKNMLVLFLMQFVLIVGISNLVLAEQNITGANTAEPAVTQANTTHSDIATGQNLELLLFQEMTVMVASQESEPLHEAPVITTVITREEIIHMGARTLNDVLLTVPGFSHIQDHNEYFSAERGIYGSSQQKILVLRDGHRLNCRSYSEANFDYSLSLDNVEKIEVLRGPGGSLYGDVALTAVVNIVTRDAKNIDGLEIRAGYGNYGQKKVAVVSGKDFGQLGEVAFSATFYENEGQEVSWPDPRNPSDEGTSLVYAFRELPAYDTYLKYRLGGLKITGSRRYGNYIEPRTGGGVTGLIYSQDDFVNFKGEAPGLSSTFDHWEIAYTHSFNDYELISKLFYDGFQIGANLGMVPASGQQGELHWKDWDGGAQVQVSKSYALGNLGKGTVLLGAKAETMEVYESSFAYGTYPVFTPFPATILKTGKERIYAGFIQVKHKFDLALIVNMGLRYDYKKRREDEVVDVENFEELSPRVAFIYMLGKNLSFRLSYSHSFVDAPYWYRYNALPSYQGAINLKPEKMDSYQFSCENSLLNKSLSNRLNIFYNSFNDVVFRDDTGEYSNAGKVKTAGIEYELGYKLKSLSVRANYTYQKTDDANGYEVKDGMLENVPQHMGNLIIDYAPLYDLGYNSLGNMLWLNIAFRYIGKQFSRWGKLLTDPEDTVDEAILCNAGFTLNELIGGLSIGFHAYNVFDKEYFQGGSVEYPYLQPGRWYLAEVSYKF